jgi:hypothetical protein
MRFTIQLIIENEHNSEVIEEVIQLKKDNDSAIGITLPESKQIMKILQNKVVLEQAKSRLELQKICHCCKRKRRLKDYRSVQFRTLFGVVSIPSPRLFYCQCENSLEKTFSPISQWLSDKNSPELQYIETKWASLIPYQLTAKLLKEVLPVSLTNNASTVRNHLQKIAKRKEKELEEGGQPIDKNSATWLDK